MFIQCKTLSISSNFIKKIKTPIVGNTRKFSENSRKLFRFYDEYIERYSIIFFNILSTIQHVIDNQKVERVTEKSKHVTDEQPATAPPSAKVKESNLQKSRSNSMRKNLKVKIKLPIENMAKIPPKKERKIQKCCLVLFLLILFILATGILIYFFGEFLFLKKISSSWFKSYNI